MDREISWQADTGKHRTRVQYEYITSHQHLRDFCQVIASAEIIAFDTEFVSEDTYLPELCLLQIAADGHLGIVDPLEFDDLSPFWELLAQPGKETLVHAGREEFRFCMRAIGRRPTNWFDVQLAAGLIGLEYPASYGTLVQKLLGKSLSKDETRTDWRKRPLTTRQIEYGLQDVVDLQSIRSVLYSRLSELGRLEWVKSELNDWQDEMERAESGERWRRVGGLSGMNPRSLAIIREIWHWRDAEGERRNIPTRRILRDDLLIELAKRQTADPKRMRAVRGMERGEILRHLPKIGACVEKALAMRDDELPQTERRTSRPQLNLLGQFLSTALGSICRSAQVAPNLAGTAQDVRDLVAYRLDLGGFAPGEKPLLATGWRAEVVGQVIDHLLSGDLAIRIADPLDHEPLVFEPCKRSE